MSSDRVQVFKAKDIRAGIVQSKIETQYPSKWFESQPGKPTVFLKKSIIQTKELGASLIQGLKTGNINRDGAKIYLHRIARTIRSRLTEDWITYGVTIGRAGEEIAVSDLYRVEEREECKDLNLALVDYHKYDLTLFLLFLHRAARFNENTQISNFTDGLKRQFISKTGELVANVSKIDIFCSWQTDREFNKIVAAFDMFFFRFSDHEQAALRYGTVTTRYRDCAGLQAVGHIAKVLGLKAQEVPFWVFNRNAAGEFMSLFKECDYEESINQLSYFPYQADFGLIRKSSYSSVAAPSLFYLLHAIGCFMRDPRSINARLNTSYNLDNLTKNALLVACAFKASSDMEFMFTEDGLSLNIPSIDDDELPNDDNGVSSRVPVEVFTFMGQCGTSFPHEECI